MTQFKLVPVEPTLEMIAAAEEAHMPFGDMDIAIRLAILAAPSPWVSVEDRLPDSGLHVLACYTNRLGKGRRIRAEYIAPKSREVDEVTADPDTQCVEYDEATDTYYQVAGWYELIDNWDEYSSIAVVEGDVNHWMPLPAAPEVK